MIADDDPNSLAAYAPKGKKLVIVTTNDAALLLNTRLDLSKFSKARHAAYRTSENEQWAHLPDIKIDADILADTMPPHSVTTYLSIEHR